MPTAPRDVLSETAKQYLCRVWPPFLVYLLLYGLAIGVDVPAKTLLRAFQFLHIAHFGLILFCGWRALRAKSMHSHALVFWFLLALLLILPGAYLEFPSDPFEHFRRMFTWLAWEKIPENDVYERFTYFWGWSLLADVPISWRRWAVGLYSGLWQLLVLTSFIRLLRCLKLDRATCYVGTFSYLAFFGSGMFGLRYYALSPFALAMVAFYGAVEVLVTQWRLGWKRCAALLVAPVAVMQFAHPGQELANFVILSSALMAFFIFERQPPIRRRRLIRGGLVLLLGGFGIFLVLRLVGGREWLSHLLWNYPVSKWGSVSFLDDRTRLFSTLGVAGLAGTVCAFFMLPKRPELALLALAPLFFLLWPPTSALLMMCLGSRGVAFIYRVLYAFPAGCLLAIYLSLKFPRFRILAVGSILVLGIFPLSPFFGRLYFQVFQPPPTLTLETFDSTAVWLSEHRDVGKMRRKCRLISDDLTYLALSTQLGLPLLFGRNKPTFEIQNEEIEKDPAEYLTRHVACGLLIVRPDSMPRFPSSEMAQLSKHWSPDTVQLEPFQPKRPQAMINALISAGWSATSVPPWYLYLEPPVR